MAWFKKQKPDPAALAPFDEKAASAKLRAFVAGKSKLLSADEIEPDTQLFSSGLLDSLAYIELVLFIEREFQLKLSGVPGMGMDSLDSISAIIELVRASRLAENRHT
jgi:acyl carrier protein